MITTGDYFKLHLIVFIWGFTAILGALVSIPSVEMVFFRTMVSALGMGALIFISGKNINATAGDILKLLLTGFIVAVHWITFFAAARVSNISVSLVGLATASFWTSLIEPLARGRKIKAFEVFLGCMVIAGLYIVFTFSFHYRMGLLLGVLSGLTSAIFSVINSKMIQRVNAYSITFYEMTGALLGTALFLPYYKINWTTTGHLDLSPSITDWFYITILGLICTVYAYSAMIELMKKLTVFFIQLTVNLEPIYGFILAVLVFGEKEKMSFNFYIGTFIILSTLISYPFLKKRYDIPRTASH